MDKNQPIYGERDVYIDIDHLNIGADRSLIITKGKGATELARITSNGYFGVGTQPIGIFNILKSLGANSTNLGIRLNVGNTTATGGAATRTDPVRIICDEVDLADDAYLPIIYDAAIDRFSGICFASLESGIVGEQVLFRFNNDSMTFISNSTNVSAMDSDNNLCVLRSAIGGFNPTYIRIRNRLGGTRRLWYIGAYGKC